MNAKPMKLIKQNGKQQENGVMIERSNLKSSPKKNQELENGNKNSKTKKRKRFKQIIRKTTA